MESVSDTNDTSLLISLSDPPLRGKCALFLLARYGRGAAYEEMGRELPNEVQCSQIIQKTKAMYQSSLADSLKEV
jgi:hypothetical protein